MAEGSRFAEYSVEELSNILENRDSTNTKNVIKAAEIVLKQYCDAKDKEFQELAEMPVYELDIFLQRFYAEIRQKNGKKYSRSSMISIRFGLQRLLRKLRNVDITNDAEFKTSKEMFQAVLIDLKRCGKGDTKHKDVISEADLQKLYKSDTFSLDRPKTLQNKVFFDMYYTCRRG